MSQTDLTPAEQAARGKRLLIYGMFSLVIVTMVALFLTLYLILGPVDAQAVAVKITLIVGGIAIIASVIVWFVYTKLILKE